VNLTLTAKAKVKTQGRSEAGGPLVVIDNIPENVGEQKNLGGKLDLPGYIDALHHKGVGLPAS